MKAILQWVLRTMMKDQTGIVRTMPRKDLVDFNVQMTAERLMRNGVDPNSLKNANQVENALNMIENAPRNQTMSIGEARGSGIKSAKIMDMEGKEIDPRSKIMGGKQAETEAEIKARLDKSNKEGIARIRAKQKRVEDAIDNMSPSLTGDTKYDATLVAEDLAERMGKVYDDLSSMEKLDLYDEAYTALSKMRFEARQTPKGAPPKITSKKDADSQESSYDDGPADFDPDADNETFAKGGRAGFFMGSKNRAGLALLRRLLNFFGNKSDKIQYPSEALKIVNPKAFNKMLEDAKGKIIPKEGIMATDKVKDYQTEMAKDRIEMVKDMIKRGKRMKGADDKILAYKNQIKNNFMKDLNMSEADAEKAAERMATFAMDVTKMKKTPEITEEGLLQLENVLKNLETGGKKKRDLNADGGRIGFKDGMTRRTFLKILGGLATLPILGKYFKGAEKAAPAAQKVMENFSSTASEAPQYFLDLLTKIKMFGKKSKVGPSDRVDEYSYTGKNGDQYTLTEDITTGDAQITKDKMGIGSFGDKTFDVIEDRTVMEYKSPKKDVDPDTQKFIDETAEYEEYKVEFDQDGTEAGADAIDEVIQKEIIEESKKAAPPIKKASGGIARMLGE